MPEGDLLLRRVATAGEDVGDALLSDGRLGHDGDELANDGLVLIYDCHGGQRGKEDGAKTAQTPFREGYVGMSEALG